MGRASTSDSRRVGMRPAEAGEATVGEATPLPEAPTALTAARPTGATSEAMALAQGAGEEGPTGADGAAGKHLWPSGPQDLNYEGFESYY